MAVEKAVASTWEDAHQIKVEAVQEALNALQIQHEKQLKKLSRQHERRVKVCYKDSKYIFCKFSINLQKYC